MISGAKTIRLDWNSMLRADPAAYYPEILNTIDSEPEETPIPYQLLPFTVDGVSSLVPTR